MKNNKISTLDIFEWCLKKIRGSENGCYVIHDKEFDFELNGYNIVKKEIWYSFNDYGGALKLTSKLSFNDAYVINDSYYKKLVYAYLKDKKKD